MARGCRVVSYPYSEEEWRALLPWVERPIPLPPTLAQSPTPGESVGERGEAEAESAVTDSGLTRDRARGMLLGLAVGDALGNTSEGMRPAERRRVHGEIRDYLPNRREEMLPVGLPSDDTQLAFWTVESLLRRGCLDPADLAESFTRQDRIFGIGSTVTAFLFAYRFGAKRWFEAGQPSAGNGALMRIAPTLLPHLRSPTRALWTDVVAATILTHRDQAAVAASVGFVGLLAECLSSSEGGPVFGEWWPETFLRYAQAVEAPGEGPVYRSRVPGDPFEGTLCQRVEQVVIPAIASGETVLEAADRWYSGAYLLETVPCVLHILARHGDDPEAAIACAVNDTKDNDTVGAIVGAAVGAIHGRSSLPSRWLAGLLGRTREDDDGRVQDLSDRAVAAFLT